jgi:hypothetical protein
MWSGPRGIKCKACVACDVTSLPQTVILIDGVIESSSPEDPLTVLNLTYEPKPLLPDEDWLEGMATNPEVEALVVNAKLVTRVGAGLVQKNDRIESLAKDIKANRD